MSFSILHPGYALLLLLVPLIWWLGREVSLTERLLRCALVAALVAALMQPVWLQQNSSAVRVFVLDNRTEVASVDKAAAQKWLLAQLNNLPEKTAVSVIQLGGEALAIPDEQLIYLPADTAHGSLAGAVQQALMQVPHNYQADVTLISNGLSTSTYWSATQAQLREKGVSLNWLQLPAFSRPLIQQAKILPARIGEALTLNLTVESLTENHQWMVEVSGENGTVRARVNPQVPEINLTLGRAKGAFASFTVNLVDVSSGQPVVEDSREVIGVSQLPLEVLALNAEKQRVSALQSLLGDGFHVSNGADQGSLTNALQSSDVVMLNDATRADFTEAQQQALLAAIAQGTGLFYSGGEVAFASGGMAGAALAKALPVRFEQNQEKIEPGVALAIVIDSSGSMQGKPLELAKQVARLAVRKLNPADQVGVVEFYGTRQWSVPLQPVKEPQSIERAISRMQSMGATQLFPAIQEAYFGLKQVPARYRHILVITDAGIEEENYQHLLRYIAQDQINVSTVLVGGDTAREAQMAELAAWGRGRYYSIADEFSMVELNFHKPSEQLKPVYQPGQFVLQGEQSAELPTLKGYARTVSKQQAQVLLTTDTNNPVLATWRYGAGRVTSFMTDPLGAGTQGWQQWPDYGQWLGEHIAHIANSRQPADIKVRRLENHIAINLSVADERAPVILENLNVATGTGTTVPLEQRAPGIYTARVSAALDEPVFLRALVNGKPWHAASSAMQDWYDKAHMSLTSQLPLIQVVKASGGSILTLDAAQLPALALSNTIGEIVLFPWLLALALFLYFAGILCRRWPNASIKPGVRP